MLIGQFRRFLLSWKLFSIKASSEAPVFIVSAGRSGSTYLRKVLISSRKITIPPESGGIIPSILNHYNDQDDTIIKIKLLISEFEKSYDFKFWNHDISYLKEQVAECNDFSLGDFLAEIYKSYGLSRDFSTDWWGDKTPYLAYYVVELSKIFPNSFFIHIVRNPICVVNSRMIHFNEGLNHAINRWKSSVKSIHKVKRKDRFLEVRYEDLISSPGVIQSIYDFIGLGRYFAEDVEDKIELGDDILPHHSRLSDLSKKTKFSLDDSQVAFIRKKLNKEMNYFGYE